MDYFLKASFKIWVLHKIWTKTHNFIFVCAFFKKSCFHSLLRFFLFLLADTNIHSRDQISNELIKKMFFLFLVEFFSFPTNKSGLKLINKLESGRLNFWLPTIHSFIHSFIVCTYKLSIPFGMLELSKTWDQFWTNFFAGHYVYQSVFYCWNLEVSKLIVHIDTLCVPIVNKLIVAILELSNIWIKILEYRFAHQQPPAAMYRLSQLSKVVLYSPFTFKPQNTLKFPQGKKKWGRGLGGKWQKSLICVNLYHLKWIKDARYINVVLVRQKKKVHVQFFWEN